MTGRVLAWAGGVVAAGAVVALAVYFGKVGLEDADKLASVIGVFVGMTGLVLSGYGIVSARRDNTPPQPEPGRQAGPGGGNTHNVISGGTVHGPVIMGRDVNLSGGIQHPGPGPVAEPLAPRTNRDDQPEPPEAEG